MTSDMLTEYFAARADLRLPLFGTEGWFAAQVRGSSPEPPPDGFLVPPGFTEELHARLISSIIDVPYELINGTPSKYPPPTRRQRFRQWRSNMRERLAERAYELISGQKMPDPMDYY